MGDICLDDVGSTHYSLSVPKTDNTSFKTSTGLFSSCLKGNYIVVGTMTGKRGDVNMKQVNDKTKSCKPMPSVRSIYHIQRG